MWLLGSLLAKINQMENLLIMREYEIAQGLADLMGLGEINPSKLLKCRMENKVIQGRKYSAKDLY